MRGAGPSGRAGGLPAVYEGPEELSALLARAGSPHDADAVAERFREAQRLGHERADVIPGLFEDEPRFASPEDARRLYGNLFALWDRLARGLSISREEPEAPPPLAPPAAALPERGASPGTVLPPALVDAVWKHLDALTDRERQRLRDRFDGAQPNVTAWLDALTLPEAAALAVHDLAFEAWAMFDVAFGDRVDTVPFQTLRATHPEPATLETTQPALAAYVSEALDLVAEEDASFGAATRAEAERVLATVAAALTEAVAAEEDA
ncbi:hypothetical protein AMYX_14260 [Anaeromyxobacter diazotrophicus]|uniref:Uncharacterized protein n=1 Tax=Anaeromyxobacter diazotrophicus TaxID=2590199 RepID=A0A7I9VJZ1_9BACT|nr:hypothetical protein AMYX_14260 [Anaeromyxobacter diazotrophicus]